MAKTYHRVEALSSINLTFNKQEVTVIIGPNGSGKSTLLKLLAGIEQPSSGKVIGLGQTAYLPQQLSLLPWRTVRQNLQLPGDISGLAPAKSQTKITKLLKDFDLLEFESLYPHQLSGGMQQKLSLLRTVLTNRPMMLLDEPFAALDAITRLEMQRWLLELKRRTGCGIICVTHDIREAVFLADTIYVLSPRPGTIKQKFKVPSKPADQAKLETQLYNLLVNKP
ncbi:MAG TPA: ABC transporter ATP-binding protein [Candidatus Dormibacteraeota bacterium]|nr:ABC transporter ATP-binding protein [Candidatus Dormibacteraeota bacterium]